MTSTMISAPTASEDLAYIQGPDRQYRQSAPGVVMPAFRAAETSRLLLVTDELDKVGGRLPGLPPPPAGCWSCWHPTPGLIATRLAISDRQHGLHRQ